MSDKIPIIVPTSSDVPYFLFGGLSEVEVGVGKGEVGAGKGVVMRVLNPLGLSDALGVVEGTLPLDHVLVVDISRDTKVLALGRLTAIEGLALESVSAVEVLVALVALLLPGARNRSQPA